MPTALDGIDDKLARWLEAQPVFFVATAPRADDQLINLSPKGLSGSFSVIDDHTVAYLDLTGSGIETVAHLRENGRIVIMFCAFDGRPNIVRLHGRGRVVLPGETEFDALIPRFKEHLGVRSVIVVDVRRTSESCGYGVPTMTYEADRPVLDLDHAKRGSEGLAAYRVEMNSTSLDGLPGLPQP
jgi:hypothetical protein